MEQKTTSIWKSSVTYGIYLGLISILLSVIIWAGGLIESLGLIGSAVIGVVSFIISFFLLLFFSKAYRNKEMGGYISFGEAFKFGILVVVFAAIITTIYNYIFYTIIDPDYIKNLYAVLQQKTMIMLENAGMSDAQMDQALEKFENIPTLGKTIRQGILSSIISGAVLSLITAAIVKKKEDTAFEE